MATTIPGTNRNRIEPRLLSPRSMTTTSLKTPSHMARSLSISHPNPPAPTTSILASRSEDDRAPTSPGEGSNSPTGNDPVSFENGLLRDSRVESVPRCRRERGGGASRRVVDVAVVDISDASRLMMLLLLLLAPSLAEVVIPGYRQPSSSWFFSVRSLFSYSYRITRLMERK